MSFQSTREYELRRIEIDPVEDVNKDFTLEVQTIRGGARRMQHMRFKRADNYSIVFWQQVKNGEREHVFDGPELLSAIRE